MLPGVCCLEQWEGIIGRLASWIRNRTHIVFYSSIHPKSYRVPGASQSIWQNFKGKNKNLQSDGKKYIYFESIGRVTYSLSFYFIYVYSFRFH